MTNIAQYFDSRFKNYKEIGYDDEKAFGWAMFDMMEFKYGR